MKNLAAIAKVVVGQEPTGHMVTLGEAICRLFNIKIQIVYITDKTIQVRYLKPLVESNQMFINLKNNSIISP